jgi:hypothetical protein
VRYLSGLHPVMFAYGEQPQHLHALGAACADI